jgi:8-oxo-dGTP diphosphatase
LALVYSQSMRTAIRREIEVIEPFDATEADHKADVLRWIDSGAELCRIQKPATPPKHLIAYFVVVDGEHVLLVDHINAGLWLPSGGHVEPGEHPRDTVQRECLEELGIEARPLRDEPVFLTVTTTVGRTAGHTDVSLWYVLQGERSRTLTFDESEFNGVRWFHRTVIPFERADPCMRRFLDKLFPQ